jgi:oligopeptidase B
MGRYWYQEGKLLKKKNTFADFISCAEFLASKKYTKKGNIVAMGGSAGGMLMGTIANEHPELFQGIVAHVPFVDVINTMLDESLPLTALEYNEWGNPNIEKYYRYMKSYSPYDNVKAQNYPHMFITAGLNDPRVTYWEPAKWTARLRAKKNNDHLVLLKTNMETGHAGLSGRFEQLKEVAEEYAFILKIFGLKQ